MNFPAWSIPEGRFERKWQNGFNARALPITRFKHPD